jgi:hypothetical protein
MALADAGWAEEQDVLASVDPGVALGEGDEARLADHRQDGEVEGVEGFAGRQARLLGVACDTPLQALGDLVLGQCCEESRGGPAFGVCGLG